MTEDDKRKKQRERWRRNKEAARAKAKPVPVPLTDDFVARIMSERDQRARTNVWDHPRLGYWKSRHLWVNWNRWRISWLEFVADVWAATILLEAQHAPAKVTPTVIAIWLCKNDRGYGYHPNSVRVRVYRAREFITALEAAAVHDSALGAWLPFRPLA